MIQMISISKSSKYKIQRQHSYPENRYIQKDIIFPIILSYQKIILNILGLDERKNMILHSRICERSQYHRELDQREKKSRKKINIIIINLDRINEIQII